MTVQYVFVLLQGPVDSLPLLSWQFAIIQVAAQKVIDPVSRVQVALYLNFILLYPLISNIRLQILLSYCHTLLIAETGRIS